MFWINKIIVILISIIIFIVLIYSTYLSNSFSSFEAPFYQNNQNGEFTLDLNSENLTKKSVDWDNGIKINYLNSFDKVLSYKGEVDYENKWETKKITLWEWVYLISITELSSSYEIILDWVRLKNNWPTNIFYDSRSKNRKTIFSLNNNVKLELLDNSWTKSNEIYLYPHMYFKYNPNFIGEVKNWDILRIKQWFNLDYFWEPIIKDNNINENFLKQVIWSTDEENVKKIFEYIQIKYQKESQILDDFKKKNFWTIIWESLIKRYNDLFLNDSKKTIYYKNLAIRYLWDIVNSKEIERQKNKEVIEVMKKLKNYSQEDYEEVKQIIDYYTTIIANWNKENVSAKINLSNIYNELDWRKWWFENDSLISINDIYFWYDFEWDLNLYNEISDDLDLFIENTLQDSKKSYLILYLSSLIKEWFKQLSSTDTQMEDIIKVFNKYADLSIWYYDIKDNTRIITWLREYIDILKNISEKIESSFFDTNDKWLLVLKEWINIDSSEIDKLERNTNKIIEFYIKNKSNIEDTSRNKILKLNFELIESNFKKYFLAIKDYNTYIANYDEASKELIQWETVNQWNQYDLTLSEEKALNYLKQFSLLDLGDVEISIQNWNYCQSPKEELKDKELKDPYCYLIQNLWVWRWVNIDFILSPYEYNRISNFVINGDPNINRWSYKLDNEKISLEERAQKAQSPEELEKYKFENFFLLTFNPGEQIEEINDEEINNKNEWIEESTIVRVFKRNKLLWENGDFKTVEWLIDIKYNDIIVTQAWEDMDEEDYKVQVKESRVSYTEWNTKYYWLFGWEYNFLPDHSFVNPYIIFQDEKWNNLLNWNTINLIWKYPIIEIKDELIKVFEKYNDISYILTNLNNKFYTREFEIRYQKNINAYFIENEDINLIIQWDEIKTLRYKWENYTKQKTNIRDINNILKLINN